MSASDYLRLGELRMRAERAEAQAARLRTAGRKLLTDCTPADIAEFEAACQWDGSPLGRTRPRMRRNPEDLIQPRPTERTYRNQPGPTT